MERKEPGLTNRAPRTSSVFHDAENTLLRVEDNSERTEVAASSRAGRQSAGSLPPEGAAAGVPDRARRSSLQPRRRVYARAYGRL
jgi:hypothetical protein